MARTTFILKPVNEKNRVISLDILRGVAVLGILVMNIQSFAMPASAYLNPTSFERLEGNDMYVWLISHVFADQKFMSIFSMLFGASMVMISQKAMKEQQRSSDLQYRRFIFLGIIGILHAYLLWAGDILLMYAICGLLMFIFRSKKSSTLIKAAIIFLIIGSSLKLLVGYSVPFWEPGEYDALVTEMWSPTAEAQNQEIKAYRGNWERQMLQRAPQAFEMQTSAFIFESFWRIAGCMLIGMALYKKRVFKLKQSNKYYFKMIGYGLGVGLPLVIGGTLLNFQYDWDFRWTFFYSAQFNYWGGILMALGYIGIIMLVCKSSIKGFLADNLANVGRMALSNYLLQTIICTSIFYGHGFALFGDLDRSAQAVIVLAIWVFQILFSSLWLNYFQFGPFEWVWRSLTYGKAQPLLKAR